MVSEHYLLLITYSKYQKSHSPAGLPTGNTNPMAARDAFLLYVSSHLLHPRRGEGDDRAYRREQSLREVAPPYVTHPPVDRHREQHAPEGLWEVKGGLSSFGT